MPARRFVTLLAAGLLPLALTACGSNRSPETYQERPTADAATSVEVLDKSGDPTDRVDIPGQASVSDQDFSVRLAGLTRALRPGEHIPLTISFIRAGRETLTVPVAVFTSPAPRPTHDVFEHPEVTRAEEAGAES